jgi:hypothetical protein
MICIRIVLEPQMHGAMAKKRIIKPKETAKVKEQGPVAPVTPPEEEKPFDFGGLPQRDIKKNLGCG